MKRECLVFFALILVLVPSAFAIANIEGPTRDVYNLGEKLDISGYILETEDMWGLMKIDLVCAEKIPLYARTVSVKADVKYEFNEQLVIPYTASGQCTALMSFNSGTTAVESVSSKGFLITKDLVGNFEVSNTMVQLGSSVSIKGKVTKQDGTKINGLATLSFKQNGENVLVDSVNVESGAFEYKFDSLSKPSGLYDIVIFVSDMYGDEKTFTDIPQITVVNQLSVVAKPNKESVLPGYVISIFGEAKTIAQEGISNANVILILDGVQYRGKVYLGEFNERIQLKDDVKSGEHNVHVIVEDNYGNIGETDAKFTVQPIPTKLEAEIVGGPFRPLEKMIVVPKLYDQAGDFIQESITVFLKDNKGNDVATASGETNSQIEFSVPEFAVPGTWYISAEASGLKIKNSFLVGEINAADYFIDNEFLIVKNVGNTKYKGEVNIMISGSAGDVNVVKKISLKPGADERFNLNDEVEISGVYAVKVADKEFANVSLTGAKSWFKYDYLYFIGVLLFAGFLIWLFSARAKIKKKYPAQKKLAVNEKSIVKAETQEDAKKRYAEDFKQMMLKSVEKRDAEINKELDNGIKKGAFSKEKNPDVVRLGTREMYKKEAKPVKIDVDSIVWGSKSSSDYEIKRPDKDERKKFKEEEKKDKKSGGLFNMFG